MKVLALLGGALALLLELTLASGLEKRDCAADNCLRQVRATGSSAQQIIASSDCSSYLASSTTTVTITPGFGQTVTASTTTKTVKVTSTSTILTTITEVDLSVEFTAVVSTSIVPDMKRHANGKAVPTYASACTSDGQYASACSCFGVLPPFTKTATAHSVEPITITKTVTTTILTQITTTKATTTTSTSTRIHSISATITVSASSFALYAVGPPLDGYYLNTLEDVPGLLEVNLFINDPFALPSFFALKNGNLWQDGLVAVSSADDYYYLTFQAADQVPDSNKLVCGTEGGVLSCKTGEGETTFYGCLDNTGEDFPPAVYFFPSGATVTSNCYPITLKQLFV